MSASQQIPTDYYEFGESRMIKMPAGPRREKRLRMAVARDGTGAWLTSRESDSIFMTRDEVVELQALLNKAFPLEALGGIE